MFFFVTLLPNPSLTSHVRTMVTLQVSVRKLGESVLKPFDISPESQTQWAIIAESLINRKRMEGYFSRWIRDPISPNEIRIQHFNASCRKKLHQTLIESKLITENINLTQSYFCFNVNSHQYIRDTNCQQHIDISLKLEEAFYNDKNDVTIAEFTNEDDNDIMVIKLEPDF